MPFGTKQPKSTPQVATPQKRVYRWGDPGVSERFWVQDTAIVPAPGAAGQQLILADAGILGSLRHHLWATNLTVTHGTGTNAKDPYGPFSLINGYQFVAGANTPIVNVGGITLGILQIVEYPARNFEAAADGASVINPLTNASDLFNHPAATGVFRNWVHIPLSLPWAGMPGGAVGYIILQNKKIPNTIKATFNLSGNAAPWNAYAAVGAVNGLGPYLVTGNDTVIGTFTMENWKELFTVPDRPEQMPRYGFTRYLQDVLMPYSGTSFTYNFEPGGVLLRAMFRFFDAGAGTAGTGGGVATNNVSTFVYQYGTNKQVDVFTPLHQILYQNALYGRALPQGTFILDYYTRTRNLVDAKSTEHIANVQAVTTFAAGYAVPANSMVTITLDKVYVVQQRLAR